MALQLEVESKAGASSPISVADPGCLSRMFIPYVYPGSRILIFTNPGSRISDPGSKNSN